MSIPKIYIGTAGWSYQNWLRSFYPKSQSDKFNWLEYYAQFFNAVEINKSYYSYIPNDNIKGWIDRVEKKSDFLFTLKLNQDFTHKKSFKKEQIDAVKENLKMLQDSNRLGGLLIQFPYSFELTKQNATHVKTLVEIFDECEKFIEIRHKSWLIDRFTDFLAKNKSSLCTIDQPEIGESVQFKPNKAGNLYLRFHGRNEKAWKESFDNYGKAQTYDEKSERYDYLYTPGELLEIERAIKEALDTVKKVYIIMNNHPNGQAIVNAFELLHLLNERMKVAIPPTTLQAYPRLTKIAL